jgi:non-homologous end joining protein Ku
MTGVGACRTLEAAAHQPRSGHQVVKQAWKDAVTGDELSRRDLLRGYEVARNEFVVIDDEEL